jgi:hypothetical protein
MGSTKKQQAIWDEQGEELLCWGSIRLLRNILQAMQLKSPLLQPISYKKS